MELHEVDGSVTVESRGAVMLIGLNRPSKRNAFDQEMSAQLCAAYTALEDDPAARCGVVFGHGGDFTAGLDLPYFAARWAEGDDPFAPPEGGVDPFGLSGRPRTKPVVAAVQGRCYTLGIELVLAADVRVASQDATFIQMEVLRGIYPVGGATVRFVAEAGWGNAMRWMLTGEPFSASEAHRMGLVQQVTETGGQLEAALRIAGKIAAAAPLAVRTARGSAAIARRDGEEAALSRLLSDLRPLLESEDAAEAITAFRERREAVFRGQ